MDKIKIATFGFEDIPIPPVKGGAVEIIIDQLSQNAKNLEWFIYSKGDKNFIARDYQNQNRNFFYYFKNRKQALFYALTKFIPEWAVYPHWITEQIIKINPDIVLLNNEITYLKYLLKIKKVCPETKVILFLHNDKVHEAPWIKKYKKNLEALDAIIGVSDYILKQTQKFIPNFPKSKMFCLHNASHLPVKPPKTSRSKIKTVLFVGRLTRYKGAYLLLEALRYFKNSNIQLVFVGSSHHGKDYIEPDFLKLKGSLTDEAAQKLTLTGFITPDKTRAYYDKADLVVFPSLWQEPSGLVLFEAWARGIPVLATNVGGIPELVKKFKHAQLVSSKISPQKLAAQIETLLKNKPKLKALSKNGLTFAKNYGNFKRMAKEFETIAATVCSDSLNENLFEYEP